MIVIKRKRKRKRKKEREREREQVESMGWNHKRQRRGGDRQRRAGAPREAMCQVSESRGGGGV